jgi:hypothetical protein
VRLHQWMAPRLGMKVVLPVVFALSGAVIALAGAGGSARAAPLKAKIEASIFSYDGQDFVRTRTTLVTKAGKLAVKTKLERDTPAYRALVQKRSYTGEATVFGRKYDANYAPLTADDGRLTGALFVGVTK